MATLDPKAGHTVLINTFHVKPGRADDLIASLSEASETIVRHMPGFISANLHVSHDGQRVVNYAQWRSKADFEAMTQDPRFKAHAQKTMPLIESFEPVLYELRERHVREKVS